MANTHVRNVGTIAGNLMLKHDHPEFPSDVFVLFEALGALIAIKSTNGEVTTYSPSEWLTLDMTKKIVLFVHLPTLKSNEMFM